MSTLSQKVILVTGASRGIGATIAQKLAAAGAKVIVNYAGGKEAAEQTVNTIKQNGGEAIALQADVSKADEDFTRQFDINVCGTFNTMREAATRLADKGSIILFFSINPQVH